MRKHKHILLGLTAILAITAPLFLGGCKEKVVEQTKVETDSIQQEEIVSFDKLTISNIDVNTPSLDEKKGTYSFNVSATLEGPAKEKAVVVYKLTKEGADNSKTVVANNENGCFSDIPGLKENEMYTVEVSVKGSADATGTSHLYTENIPMVEKVKQLTAADLTVIIMSYAKGDNTAYTANKDCLAPDCKFYTTDGSESLLGIIAESISFEDWSSIEFISVEYDSFNRIKKATFKINYPN